MYKFILCLLIATPALAAMLQSGSVTSINSLSGDVTLVKGDVGLANADDTSDANKPVSIATQAALDEKAHVAKGVYTFSSTKPADSTFDFGFSVPAGSIVTGRAFIRTIDQVVSVDNNLMNIGCGASPDNIYSDTIGPSLFNTVEVVSGPSFYTASGCTPTATVGAGASGITAGEIQLILEYFIVN